MGVLSYIDLPSGSAIFQILIAGLLGISVALRSFWSRVWQLLTGRRRPRRGAESPAATTPRPAVPGRSSEGPSSPAEGSVREAPEDAPSRKG
jgi:hypothetical protein